MTLVDLALGPRPDEPGPPLHGPAAYPHDVETRLAADAAAILARYPQPRSALLPLLHLVQAEDGYVTTAGIRFCAAQLNLTDAEVSAVATFYSMYRRTPTGTYLLGVCTNTLCAVMGGDAILATLEEHLGIGPGETTGDGAITLEHLECNAACDYAPVIMVNWQFYDNQTPSSATALADSLRSGTPAPPTRGTPLPTFTTTCRVLAGLPTDLGEGTGPGPATLAGLRIADRHDMTAPPDTGPATEPSSSADAPEPEAVESVRDEPAPAPSATVPAEPGTEETDPSTTGD
ncbi:NADH-quinone oxidoreductase subunit E [Mycobacterium sp. MS1601]|uniref:NADH-quinone oxidoreductase subunit NuoE n=1 Tax=Mycobacterium sp. MS1601 TaxID=1936029 RepID=UPI0009797079|nr:NADH-quinone oxidoreductase subunit NuoE [Mycobacterium sp. MS1601]AQA01286.1 NADH-quinone oxidoreductase subunit E [Mycobacterium sp. MS1601]